MVLLRTVEFAALCFIAVLAISLWPPKQGELVVYYPLAGSESRSLQAVYSTDAKLIAKGPISRSWIVWVDEPKIGEQLVAYGGILLNTEGLQGCVGKSRTRNLLERQGYTLSAKRTGM